MICIKCGIKVGENDKFCPNCGNELLKKVKENKKIELPTDNISDEDIENGRALSIFCYFGPLVLIPAIFEKKNGYVIHNANQGFCLLVYEVFLFFARYIFSFNPLLFRSFEILSILSILFFCVFGIINSYKGKTEELPLFGKCNLLLYIKYRNNITENKNDEIDNEDERDREDDKKQKKAKRQKKQRKNKNNIIQTRGVLNNTGNTGNTGNTEITKNKEQTEQFAEPLVQKEAEKVKKTKNEKDNSNEKQETQAEKIERIKRIKLDSKEIKV